jgi:transposase
VEHYAGIDVSLENASLCVVDATGRIVREVKVAREPEVLIGWFRGLGLAITRIGLEAGPLSQWLYAGMWERGLAVELLETRHVRDAFKAMPVKTDSKDARGIAQLMPLGWFRAVHCKSLPAQEMRALLTARKLLQSKNHDVGMSLRGVLRGFGVKVGPTTPRTFANRIRELVAVVPHCQRSPRRCLRCALLFSGNGRSWKKHLRSLAREEGRARRLMTAPGQVLPDLDRKRLTTEAAARLLGLERRQVFRLLKAYRTEGPNLISKRRGRRSNRRKPEALRKAVLAIIREAKARFVRVG